MGGAEPSDAIRVVNAVLTAIDQLKARPNVLVLTTSNITGAIDIAFVDRADITQYIGNPGEAARYTVLASCITELVRVGIVRNDAHDPVDIPPFHAIKNSNSRAALMLHAVSLSVTFFFEKKKSNI